MKRLIVGCMSGTSIDALDAALVEIAGRGLDLRARVLEFASTPLSAGPELRRLAEGEPFTARRIVEAAAAFAADHVHAILKPIERRTVDLIVCHGQTVFHAPPLSWQLLSPAAIARSVCAPVLFDLRSADIAAGGQGAPITPLADFILFRSETQSRVIVNLGGFANYTWLPAATEPLEECLPKIRGGDICACNQVLDALARRVLHEPFDRDGQAARQGNSDPTAHDDLLSLLRQQAGSGRSLGTGDELAAWLDRFADRVNGQDLARSACEAIARVIGESIPRTDAVLLAGGGALNLALREALVQQIQAPVRLTDEYGVGAQQREAVAMAVLGAMCQDRIPITLPQITHVPPPAPIAGAWVYP